jgi:hypothetical protein
MPTKPKYFRLGQFSTNRQVIRALGKTIRAMAADTIDSAKGARICAGLGILRTCFETQMLETIQARINEIAEHAVAEAAERAGERSGMLIEHEDHEPSLQ